MPDLADCRDIAFNEIIVRNEASGAYAYFKLNEPSVSYKMSATDYYTTVSEPVFPFLSIQSCSSSQGPSLGTWTGLGAGNRLTDSCFNVFLNFCSLAAASYSYQVGICDSSSLLCPAIFISSIFGLPKMFVARSSIS